MLKRLLSSMMTLALVVGIAVSATTPAEAGRRGRDVGVGIAAGIIGLGILGAYANARDRHRYDHYERSRHECYKGPEECGWVNRRCFTNSWGERVCRGGRWTCWRDTYCD